MRFHVFLAMALLLWPMSDMAVAQEITRCLNAEGRTVYTTTPARDCDAEGGGVKIAIEAYAKGDYDTAAEICTRWAERGDSLCSFLLGRMNLRGESFPINPRGAMEHFQRAAAIGLAHANTALGQMYAEGIGVAVNDSEAIQALRRAVDRDNAEAQYRLAVLNATGRGMRNPNPEVALELFLQAANNDEWYADEQNRQIFGAEHLQEIRGLAQLEVAIAYAEGIGVQRNDQEAVNWYQAAAENGNAIAQNNLGNRYNVGRGVPQDYAEARRWYRRAAEQGLAVAQNSLGVMLEQGLGGPPAPREATYWYDQAAEQGLAIAQNNAGKMYAEGRGVPRNDSRAFERFQEAADQGLPEAQYNLGRMYAEGRGRTRDERLAMQLFNLAANRGSLLAMYEIGNMLAKRGGPRDYREAAVWYRRAAEREHVDSMFRLGIIYAEGLIDGTPVVEEAVVWLRNACQAGHAEACQKLSDVQVNHSAAGLPRASS